MFEMSRRIRKKVKSVFFLFSNFNPPSPDEAEERNVEQHQKNVERLKVKRFRADDEKRAKNFGAIRQRVES